MKLSVELKVMLVDAVATLYFIDEHQNSESNELLTSLQKIPEASTDIFNDYLKIIYILTVYFL